MRVYLPATVALLAEWLDVGAATAAEGFTVTPQLREAYREGDLEELEWVAQRAAARAALSLLARDQAHQVCRPTVRVVLAVDVADVRPLALSPLSDEPSAVGMAGPVRTREWASVLADDPSAAADLAVVAAAVDVVRRGGGGPDDPDGRDHLDDADAVELGWWAVQELPTLLRAASGA